MTFLNGLVLVVMGAAFGFVIAAVASSAGRADERAELTRKQERLAAKYASLERRYLDLVEATITREHREMAKP